MDSTDQLDPDRLRYVQAVAYQLLEHSLNEDIHSAQVLLDHVFTTDPDPADAAQGITFAILGAVRPLFDQRCSIPMALERLKHGQQLLSAEAAIDDAFRDVDPKDL